jgi:hypothetical protein
MTCCDLCHPLRAQDHACDCHVPPTLITVNYNGKRHGIFARVKKSSDGTIRLPSDEYARIFKELGVAPGHTFGFGG